MRNQPITVLSARGAPPPLALARRLPPSLKLRRTAVALAEAGRASPFGRLTATLSGVEGSLGPQALCVTVVTTVLAAAALTQAQQPRSAIPTNPDDRAVLHVLN